MRMKRVTVTAMALFLLLALAGCAPQAVNPLLKNEATSVPGLTTDVAAASAGESKTDPVEATLYFRYLDEPMLAAETRTLSVPQDQSVEYAVIQALVEGPSAGHSELKRLLPAGTTVESVISRGDILFVTFGEGFLNDGVPKNWLADANWNTEAPVLRKLVAQSIVASVTEISPYTGIQILVNQEWQLQNSLRLENSYFLDGSTGLSDPIARDEALLLTPQNTADILLTAWQQHDYERMYRFVAEENRPLFSTFTVALSAAGSLQNYGVGGGNVAGNGQEAVMTASLSVTDENGNADESITPVMLTRENGIWKITYARLLALMTK
jgi:hypothetical protein